MSDQMERLIQTLRANSIPEGTSIPEIREIWEASLRPTPVSSEVSVEPSEIAGRRVELISKTSAKSGPMMIYLHGGGYVLGSLDTTRAMVSYIVEQSNLQALTIEYSLAPEAPYPAAVNDIIDVYSQTLRNGVDPRDVVIGGDSAGGGLALAVLVALRERGMALPGAGVLLSPFADLTLTSQTFVTNDDSDPQIHRWLLTKMASGYAGDVPVESPKVSPARASLVDLPPLLIQVGELEMLLDDARMIAQSAMDVGTPARLEVWPGMIHGWHYFAPRLEPAMEALRGVGEWADQALARRA